MSNEKTVWNKELFSDTYETEKHNDDNFQTMNMIYKIEKINKAKKVNNQKNYQKNNTGFLCDFIHVEQLIYNGFYLPNISLNQLKFEFD